MTFSPIANALLLSCAMAASAGVAAAQAPGSGAVRLARVNVVVFDAQGQPVSNLTADDFRIATDGKAQRIALFRGPAAARAAAPRELSNRAGAGAHTTAVLFDLMTQNRTDRLDAARRLGQSLKQLESGESVFFYLLLLDGTLAPLRAFPESGTGANDGAWAKDADAALAKVMKTQNGTRPAGMSQEDAVKKTYVALETLANRLAVYPGAHDIVWITNDVPTVWGPKTCSGDWIECALYVPHLSVTLERAETRVHPLSYASGVSTEAARMLDEVAGLTGGRARFNDDLRAVVQQLGQAGQGAYSLAYEPSPESWDSKFHKLRVTCERKAVKLEARQRYYALPDSRPAQAREQGALVAAYQSVNDVAEIAVRASVTIKAPNTAHVEIRVDADDLLLRESGAQLEAELTVLFSARTAAGPQGEPTLTPWPVRLTKEQRETARKDGIVIARDYPIDAATQKARIIVLDRGTDSVGSLTAPITR
jgi:VWFA-related protein